MDLNRKIKHCLNVGFQKKRINDIWREYYPNDKLLLIAQSPGENKDRKEKMFILPSGNVLDELLMTSDLKRKGLYMNNLIKCIYLQNIEKQNKMKLIHAFVSWIGR